MIYNRRLHSIQYDLENICIYIQLILRASKNEKPYKNIYKTNKTDPESHRNYKNHTKKIIKLIKLILRQLWRPGSLGCTIVVSGSVLSVLSMFLYGFYIFGSPQDQSYQYYHIFVWFLLLEQSHNEKTYKHIRKTKKKQILRQLWGQPGCQGTIVAPGSVLSVLSMFLYGFCIFGSPQDQSYQYDQCICMVFASGAISKWKNTN